MFWLIFSVCLLTVSARTLPNIEEPPKGCEWQMQPAFDSETSEEPVLDCQIKTINGADSLLSNLTQSQADRVTSLKLECTDVWFFESTLVTRQGTFLSSLRRLMDLRMEHCKIGRACISSLEILDLSNNDIISWLDNGLSGLRSPEEFHLQNNAISILAGRPFMGLDVLYKLNLSSNCLVALPPDLFDATQPSHYKECSSLTSLLNKQSGCKACETLAKVTVTKTTRVLKNIPKPTPLTKAFREVAKKATNQNSINHQR